MTAERSWQLSRAALVLLFAAYAMQALSPLRVNGDALALLSMADSAVAGQGFLDSGHRTNYPPGYPAVLALMLGAGMAHGWSIVLLNVLFVGVALRCTYVLLSREDLATARHAALLCCCLVMLSFVVLKHAVLPATDTAFLAGSMLTLLTIDTLHRSTARGGRRALLAGVCVLLIAASVMVRWVGVALIPPLLFALAAPVIRTSNVRSVRAVAPVVIVVVIAAVLGTAFIVTKVYLSQYLDVTKGLGLGGVVAKIAGHRLREFGELVANVPTAKVGAPLRAGLPVLGALFVLAMVVLARRLRRPWRPAEVFVAGYAAILLVWPYYDARFWLPVLPVLAGFVVVSLRQMWNAPAARVLACLWLFGFASLGITAIGYSTKLTFSGRSFPDRFGDGEVRSAYCVVMDACGVTALSETNERALRLLRRFW